VKFKLQFLVKIDSQSILATLRSTRLLSPPPFLLSQESRGGSPNRCVKTGCPLGLPTENGILDTNGDVEVAIGNQPTGAGNKPFDGLIDDLRIYNVALSQSEIQELMYSSEEPICTECDFYPDGMVDGKDLWIFIEHWLK
jgi:hypothetical protein